MAVKKQTDGFMKFAAGNKTYGGGRPMPTVGPVDPIGYKERDAKASLKQAAARRLARIKGH